MSQSNQKGFAAKVVDAYRGCLQQAGKAAERISTDFQLYFEPEAGINDPEEFRSELLLWARKEHRQLEIAEPSMTPVVKMDGKQYLCRLGDPDLQRQKLLTPLVKTGITHSVGPMLGYKWVYLYEM